MWVFFSGPPPLKLPKTISKEKREGSSSLVYVLHKTWSWVFRLRPHLSGYFWIQNFFFPGTAFVHTYPVDPYLFESALRSVSFWIRYVSAVLWMLNPDIFFIRWCNKIEPSSLSWKAEKDEKFKFGIRHDTQLKNTAKYTKHSAGKELPIAHHASVIWKGLVKHRQILETLPASNMLLHFFATVRPSLPDFNFKGVHLYWSKLE